VDRLDFIYEDNIAEMKTIKPKAADHPTFGGSNVAWSVGPRNGAPFGVINNQQKAWIGEIGDPVKEAWMWELYDAKLKFKVIYYDSDGFAGEVGGVGKGPTRDITMLEYIRAMYTVDEYGTPKATLPIFTGYSQERQHPGDVTTPLIDNPSSPQYWAYMDGDLPLYMTLFYYSDLIMPAIVKNYAGGDYHLDMTGNGDPTPSVKGKGRVRPNANYLNGNGAQIPIATDTPSVHKVATFSSIKAVRTDNSAHDGFPTILGTTLNADDTTGFPYLANGVDFTGKYQTRKDLYGQLRKYWKPVWVYDNLEDVGQTIDLDAELTKGVAWWYNFDGSAGGPTGRPPELLDFGRGLTYADRNKYHYYPITDVDLDAIEEVEQRTMTVLFPAPPSVGPGDDDEVDFGYWVKP